GDPRLTRPEVRLRTRRRYLGVRATDVPAREHVERPLVGLRALVGNCELAIELEELKIVGRHVAHERRDDAPVRLLAREELRPCRFRRPAEDRKSTRLNS